LLARQLESPEARFARPGWDVQLKALTKEDPDPRVETADSVRENGYSPRQEFRVIVFRRFVRRSERIAKSALTKNVGVNKESQRDDQARLNDQNLKGLVLLLAPTFYVGDGLCGLPLYLKPENQIHLKCFCHGDICS
jgi:hypothetical protein